jgi:hypothetical protein
MHGTIANAKADAGEGLRARRARYIDTALFARAKNRSGGNDAHGNCRHPLVTASHLPKQSINPVRMHGMPPGMLDMPSS